MIKSLKKQSKYYWEEIHKIILLHQVIWMWLLQS
jgi:hypothetical protein